MAQGIPGFVQDTPERELDELQVWIDSLAVRLWKCVKQQIALRIPQSV